MENTGFKDTEQENTLLAGLRTLSDFMPTFAIAGFIGAIDEEMIDALKQALVIPLACLEVTPEQYQTYYNDAQASIERVRAITAVAE